MAANNSFIPASYTPYLANASAVVAAVPTAVGALILAKPQFAFDILSFPPPTALSDHTLALGLSRIFGARDLAVGITTFAIWWSGRKANGNTKNHLLGVAMLSGALMVVTDGFVSRSVIGKGEWTHWGFAPLNIGLGLGLLGAM